MCVIFMSSLALASWLKVQDQPDETDYPQNTPTKIKARQVTLGETTLIVPNSWEPTTDTNAEQWLELTNDYLILVDPERPTRRLRLACIDFPETTSPGKVFHMFLGDEISYFEPLSENYKPFVGKTHSGSALMRTRQYNLTRNDQTISVQSQISLAAITLNNSEGKRFWLIYFSDVIPAPPEGDLLQQINDSIFIHAVMRARPVTDDNQP